VRGRNRRSVNAPSARPATTSLAQCVSRTTRASARPAPNAQTRLRFARGSTLAADTSAPAMTGRESVERPSGERHAVEMAAYGQAVRPPLIEDRLEQMRDSADGKRRQQDVVAVPARARRTAAAIQPPARDERQQHMLVGAQAKPSSRAFGAGTGVFGNGVRNLNVACGGGNPVGHDHHTSSQGFSGVERLALRRVPEYSRVRNLRICRGVLLHCRALRSRDDGA
jgi:hypothetical protein